jgi:hypothetical protein
MTDKQTVPPDFEEYAIEQARRIAAIDRCRLPGSEAQFKAIVQIAIADAMMFAAELRRRPHITIHSNRIELSPSMPLADHEMDVLRALASRIKVQDFRKDEDSSPAFLRRIHDSSTCTETQTGGEA